MKAAICWAEAEADTQFVIFLAITMGVVMLFTLPWSVTANDYDDDDVCIRVHAKIKTNLVPQNQQCDSPIGICTEGRITRGGLLNGTTYYVAGKAGPGAGMIDFDPNFVLSYAGELAITTKRGTLITEDLGVVDYIEGAFSEFDIFTGGTGIFEGATSTLFVFGETTADGSEGKNQGNICLAIAIDD
jgi:nitrogen fixation-related uncharacterized protein